MTTIRVSPEGLPEVLMQEHKQNLSATTLASHGAARKYQTFLMQMTDNAGITDRGLFKRSWKTELNKKYARVYNDAPYAGIIENGARPHKVGLEVIKMLASWAQRKLGVDKKDAMSVGFAIANKIAKFGVKGRFLVAKTLPQARAFYRDELSRIRRRK